MYHFYECKVSKIKFIEMTVLRMSPASLKCNATIAVVKVSRQNIEQTVRQKNNPAT